MDCSVDSWLHLSLVLTQCVVCDTWLDSIIGLNQSYYNLTIWLSNGFLLIEPYDYNCKPNTVDYSYTSNPTIQSTTQCLYQYIHLSIPIYQSSDSLIILGSLGSKIELWNWMVPNCSTEWILVIISFNHYVVVTKSSFI